MRKAILIVLLCVFLCGCTIKAQSDVKLNDNKEHLSAIKNIVAAEKVEKPQDKIKYLENSYNNYLNSKNDEFLAASQAIAIGKEYYKINQYEKALNWFEKARPYYEKTNYKKLGALPIYLGDVNVALGNYMSAMELYTEAYENLCSEINELNQNHCNDLYKKIQNLMS